MTAKIDRRNHSPAVERRPIRHASSAVVIHHLAVDVAPKDGLVTVEDAIQFFTRDPEGISTVCVAGSYETRKPQIEEWKKLGIPPRYADSGYVPYHFVIDRSGQVFRMLDLQARGAHAGNHIFDWNEVSVGIAFLGDFTHIGPTEAELAAGVALLEDLRVVYPAIEILGHDETLRRNGLEPKGCPGPMFPLNELRERVRRVKQ